MKNDIHPTYFSEARVVCACGNTWNTGSTQEEIRTDVSQPNGDYKAYA